MTLRVRVETPRGSPAEYALDGAEMIIGRAATAAIVISDSRVSRQHARLIRRDGGWWVEDLGARNRTLLNGAPLQRAERVSAGDRLEVGDAVLVLDDGEDRGRTASAPGATALGDDTLTRAVVGDAARMWTLNEIHRAIAGPLSLSELLDVILARCFDAVHPEEGVIMLRGADGALTSVASRRRDARPGAVVVPRRLVEEVVGKGQPALVLDAAYDERFAGSASMVSSGFRSVVAAPIVDAEGTLGLIALCSRIAVRQFQPPDLDMLVSIASAAALRVRNVALADDLAARRVVERELELAHEVQMAMLPRAMPLCPGLAVAAQLKPARSVGGDLYDVRLDGDRLWFIVADVAGKSIAAALYMAIARALFRAAAGGGATLTGVVTRMNEELARDNERMMFVTALVGCLDLRTSELGLVDAGHNTAMLAADGRAEDLQDVPKGTALGVIENAEYRQATFALPPGATLVLYTDGLTDARAANGEMFGEARLRAAIAAAATGTPAALVSTVFGAIERFAAGAPPEDDLTLLALRYDARR